MCVNPPRIQGVLVSCRKCKECKAMWQRNMIGRVLSEQMTCQATWFATFTYGHGDHTAAFQLNYAHMQLVFKRLRKAGHKFKYIVVGEYGEQRGRAHWHVLFFWENDPPKISSFDKRLVNYPLWQDEHGVSRGYVQFELPRHKAGAAHYILQYLDKEQKNLREAELRFSKNPIGLDYLLAQADAHVRQGLPLFGNGAYYEIPDSVRRNGELFKYYLAKDTVLYRKMYERYVSEWSRLRPGQKVPYSESLVEYEDMMFNRGKIKKRTEFTRETSKRSDEWKIEPPTKVVAVYCCSEPKFQVQKHSDGMFRHVCLTPEGEMTWQETLESEEEIKEAIGGRRQTPVRLLRVRNQ